MTRVLGLDLETTGLDTAKDRIIELGAVVWETETAKPLKIYSSLAYSKDYPELPELITNLTGISQEDLTEFGRPLSEVVTDVELLCQGHGVKFIIAHNGENFDKPMLLAELRRLGVAGSALETLPWLDTKNDIPFGREPDSRRLNHLAMDLGFINPFQHRAVFDVMTMLRVMAHYDFEQIVEYSKVPWITVRAVVDFANKERAKEQRYSWEKLGDRVFPKQWIKRIKVTHLAAEKEKLKPFHVAVLEGKEHVEEAARKAPGTQESSPVHTGQASQQEIC